MMDELIVSPSDVGLREIKQTEPIPPSLCPPRASPIEVAYLKLPHDDISDNGTLRYIVDLQIGDEPYDPVNMEAVRREKQVEVRMLIKRVDNISIFRDFGERNDVRVEGGLSSSDLLHR